MLTYRIDKADVLANLGYADQQINASLHQKIDACIALSYRKIVPAFTFETFAVRLSPDGADIGNPPLHIASRDVGALLRYSNEAVVMALSAGAAIEQAIRTESYRDMTSSVILDSCASVAAESIAEALQQQIEKDLCARGLALTNRFSCGYGDFSLQYQSAILRLLNAEKKIGLYASETGILQPKKSITAVMGITDSQIRHTHYATCAACAAKESCAYRKEGKTCFN